MLKEMLYKIREQDRAEKEQASIERYDHLCNELRANLKKFGVYYPELEEQMYPRPDVGILKSCPQVEIDNIIIQQSAYHRIEVLHNLRWHEFNNPTELAHILDKPTPAPSAKRQRSDAEIQCDSAEIAFADNDLQKAQVLALLSIANRLLEMECC